MAVRGKETITVRRSTRRDPLQPGTAGETEHEVKGCIIIPRASNEEGQGWVQQNGYTIYAPPKADVLATDTLEVRGERQTVIGKPGLLKNKAARSLTLAITTEAVSSGAA